MNEKVNCKLHLDALQSLTFIQHKISPRVWMCLRGSSQGVWAFKGIRIFPSKIFIIIASCLLIILVFSRSYIYLLSITAFLYRATEMFFERKSLFLPLCSQSLLLRGFFS